MMGAPSPPAKVTGNGGAVVRTVMLPEAWAFVEPSRSGQEAGKLAGYEAASCA